MGVQAGVSLGSASGAGRARVCTWVSQKMAYYLATPNAAVRCHQEASGMLMGAVHFAYAALMLPACVCVCELFYAAAKPHLTIKPYLQQSLIVNQC